ncbi:MAG: hypothetical protein INR66_14940 [Gordonia polyisoprenivorans]|nr:hypothetical protein [Gordonia polyisoprenivorans]
MDSVWLSTKYYLDPKLADAPATTERMFSRLLAYCGANNTRGNLPPKCWNFVGIPSGKRSVFDLVSRGVLIERADGGFRFPAWGGWQEQADKLAQRRENDRKRKRAQREREEGLSRDVSRDVTALEEKRKEEKTSTYVDRATYVPDATDEDAPVNERPTGPAIAPDAARLVREVIPANHPDAVKSMLRMRVSEMLKAGTEPETVRQGLEAWLAKPGVGPNTLPSFVSDVLKARQPPRPASPVRAVRSTTDERIAAAQALKEPPPDNIHHLREIER